MPEKTRKACDKFQLIADKLLHLMESGTLPWRKPWHFIPCGNDEYSGMNPLLAQLTFRSNAQVDPTGLSSF